MPWSRLATKRSMPTVRPTRPRRSMSSARAPGMRRRRAAGGWPRRRRGTPTNWSGRWPSALKPEAKVLYLAGRDRKDVIEAALAETFELEVVEAYAAEARAAWRPAEARSLASCVAALHYSRRSAGLAAALAKTAGVEACFLKLKHVCISRDVAEPLQAIGATRIAIAETPDEAGLFRRLRDRGRRVPFPRVVPYIGRAKT